METLGQGFHTPNQHNRIKCSLGRASSVILLGKSKSIVFVCKTSPLWQLKVMKVSLSSSDDAAVPLYFSLLLSGGKSKCSGPGDASPTKPSESQLLLGGCIVGDSVPPVIQSLWASHWRRLLGEDVTMPTPNPPHAHTHSTDWSKGGYW